MTVTLRPSQEYAIPAILGSLETKPIVVFDGPTGSGKSVVAVEVAKRLGLRSFITSPQVSLVEQYTNDPRLRELAPDLRSLTGKRNYECLRDRNALAIFPNPPRSPISAGKADCYELDGEFSVEKNLDREIIKNDDGSPIQCRHKKWRLNPEVFPDCDYYIAKAEAEVAPITVTTLAFYLTGVSHFRNADGGPTIPTQRLSSRPVLVVDEVHLLEEEAIRHFTTKLTDESFDFPAYKQGFSEWVAGDAAGKIFGDEEPEDSDAADAVETYIELLESILVFQEDAQTPGEIRTFRRIEETLLLIETVGSDIRSGVPWVVRLLPPGPTLEIVPVVAAPHLARRLWSKAEKVVVMSATVFDPRGLLDEIGLPPGQARIIGVKSEFPPEYGPIFKVPVTPWSYETRFTAPSKIIAALERVMDLYPERRGIVHAQSFENVERIRDSISSKNLYRLYLHSRDGMNREDLIDRFVTSPPGSVLVSPSMTEGLDLTGDLGEWCVFVKAPFASKNDPRVKKRLALPDGERWYERKAVAKTIQGRGRIIRSKEDFGPTWILDTVHVRLLNRWYGDLPTWFREAIDAGERLLPENVRSYVLRGGML